jgi:putative transposase
MSIWEYRRVRRRLEAQGVEDIDEELIFRTFKEMRAIEERSARETKSRRREAQRRRLHREVKEPQTADVREKNSPEEIELDEEEALPVIMPFNEREYLK